MSNQIRTSLNNQKGTAVTGNQLLTATNGMNNLWSALNNYNTGDEAEAIRSVFLAVFSITENFRTVIENSKSPTFKKYGGVISHLAETAILGDRLIENLNKYWDYRDFNETKDTNGNQVTYNNGMIPVTNILDVKSDILALSKKVLDIIDVLDSVTGKLVTPYSIALDVVAVLITAVSNSIGTRVTNHENLMQLDQQYSHLTDDEKKALQQKWLDENHSIHKDEFSFGEVFGEAIIESLTSWGTVTALLEEVLDGIIPDDLNPFETPNDIDLIGSADNDVIDADSWFDDAYRIYGHSGNDTLIGGDHNDKILGGTGNDIINGKEGDDKLDGAEGYDTYHIKDHDTIYDADGKGKILFNNQALPKAFILKQGVSGVWEAKDSAGNVIYTAIQGAGDLLITSTNSPADRVTIKDFFTIARTTGTTHSALSITLADSQADADKYGVYTIKTDDKLSSAVAVGGFPSDYIVVIGSDEVDNISGGFTDKFLDVQTGGGNDLINGSNKSDVVKGGAGHDVISGSAAYYDLEAKDSTKLPPRIKDEKYDEDLLIGNDGNDLMAGGIGDDVIWVDNDYVINKNISADKDPNNPNNAHNNKKGDWALGGQGNDVIYGGVNKDFLQGGADSDHIYGGGGDDVILGDGHIRFGIKLWKIDNNSHIDSTTNPTYPIHPLVPPIHTIAPTFNQGKELSVDYTFVNGKQIEKKLPNKTIRDVKTFDWSVETDHEKGDYTLNTHKEVKPMYSHHILPEKHAGDNTTDFLYGGAGNDLLIGQYGHDVLDGGDGNDTLWGDDNKDPNNPNIVGNDILKGGAGRDTLIGGLGFDTYRLDLEDLKVALRDNKVIKDSDNKGTLIVAGQDWAGKQWRRHEYIEDVYFDGKGNKLVKQGQDYLITGADFDATITIKDISLGANQKLLGMDLIHKVENTAPFVKKNPRSQFVSAGQDIRIDLNGTFDDIEDTESKLVYALQGGQGLHFDPTTKILTGKAPESGSVFVSLTATDSKGLMQGVTFELRVGSGKDENGNDIIIKNPYYHTEPIFKRKPFPSDDTDENPNNAINGQGGIAYFGKTTSNTDVSLQDVGLIKATDEFGFNFDNLSHNNLVHNSIIDTDTQPQTNTEHQTTTLYLDVITKTQDVWYDRVMGV